MSVAIAFVSEIVLDLPSVDEHFLSSALAVS